MSLRHSAGRIWITDPTDTEIVFDTDERLFIVTDWCAGSQAIPERYAEWNKASNGQESRIRVDVENTYTLATINAGANAVVGAFKVTSSSAQGVHNFGWFCAGGTYIHSQLPKTSFYNGITFYNAAGAMSGYTFRAVNGSLQLHERAVFDCPQPEYTGWFQSQIQSSMTIEYKLYAGSFV